jgi:predicted phosphoribosyltransferase
LWNVSYFVSLKGNAIGRAVFEVINDFFNEQKIKWQWREVICIDGGAAMTGRLSGLVSWVRRKECSYFKSLYHP